MTKDDATMSEKDPTSARHRLMVQRIQQGIALKAQEEGRKITVHSASLEVFGKPDTLQAIVDGRSRNPREATMQPLAEWLETTVDYLRGIDSPVPPTPAVSGGRMMEADRVAEAKGSRSWSRDIPVMGTAAASIHEGAFQFEGGVVDRLARPPRLAEAVEIYGLYVEGDSMEPRYYAGDPVIVNPRVPARVGDDVIVQEERDENSGVFASLGQLGRATGEDVVIEKLNPVGSEVRIPRRYVKAVHRVVPLRELLG